MTDRTEGDRPGRVTGAAEDRGIAHDEEDRGSGRDEEEVDDRRRAFVFAARSGETTAEAARSPKATNRFVTISAFMEILLMCCGPRPKDDVPDFRSRPFDILGEPRAEFEVAAGTMPRRKVRLPWVSIISAAEPEGELVGGQARRLPDGVQDPKMTDPGSRAAETASMRMTFREPARAMSKT